MGLTRIDSFSEGNHAGTCAPGGGGLVLKPGAQAGEWLSPVYRGGRFDWAVASWNGEADLEVAVRVGLGHEWSPWFSYGRWCPGPERRSLLEQEVPGVGALTTDTLTLERPAQVWQLRVSLEGGRLERLWLATALRAYRSPEGPYRPAWGKELPVPLRSQMVYPNGGRVWCSPTSLAMVMAFWGHEESIPGQVVPGVYDPVYGGHGNWPFNTAYAGLRGFEAWVDRLPGLADLERLVAGGLPVIASVSYQKAWLQNAPIDQTAGHLLVVRGFTAEGDVIVNDPAAASDEEVRRVYRREQFRRAWLDRGGVVYVLRPAHRP